MNVEPQLVADVLAAANSLTAAVGRLASAMLLLAEKSEPAPFMKPVDLANIPAIDVPAKALVHEPAAVRPVWLDCPRGAVSENVCCKDLTGCRIALVKASLPHPATETPAIDRSGPQLSPERRRLIAVEYGAGVASKATFERVNAMPGRPFPNKDRIGIEASALGVRRPKGFDWTKAPDTLEEARRIFPPAQAASAQPVATPPAAPSKPVSAPPAPPMVFPRAAPGTALPPVTKTWGEIKAMAYAAGHVLRSLDDLPTYNRLRINKGEAPFALPSTRRP